VRLGRDAQARALQRRYEEIAAPGEFAPALFENFQRFN